MTSQIEQVFEILFQDIPRQPPRDPELLQPLSSRRFLRDLLVVLGFLILFGGVCFSMLFTEKHLHIFWLNMRSTQGTVVDVCSFSASDAPKKGGQYVFSLPNGETVSGNFTASVQSPSFDLAAGDAVPIRYDANDPTFNGLESDMQPDWTVVLFPSGVWVFMVLFVGGAFLMEQPPDHARKVFKKGIITRGALVHMQKSRLRTSYKLTVSFVTDSGERIEADVRCRNAWLYSKLMPEMSLTIAYLPENPTQCIALELYAR